LAELAYLSLGSNEGDRRANLQAAIERLSGTATLTANSGFYETEPVEVRDQPWFLNCIVAVETKESPRELLERVLRIEREMGRVRLRDKGPRVIDIDIILFGDRIVDEPGLKIPHPGLQERRFVLAPLAEIAPDVRHPILGRTSRQLLAALGPGQVVHRLPSNERN